MDKILLEWCISFNLVASADNNEYNYTVFIAALQKSRVDSTKLGLQFSLIARSRSPFTLNSPFCLDNNTSMNEFYPTRQ